MLTSRAVDYWIRETKSRNLLSLSDCCQIVEQ